MKVAALQSDIVWEDREANFERVAPWVGAAAAAGARLLLLPEMFACGFTMATDRVAEPPEGPTTAFLREQAARHRLWVAGSLPERPPESDRPYNTLLLAGPGGEVTRYRKIHPFTFAGEDRHYAAGDRHVTVEVEGARCTLFVCYDLRFADEFWATAHATDVYLVPANWPERRRHHWTTLLAARAIENQAYVVGVNRVGYGGDLAYVGDSRIVDPWGEVLASAAGRETLILADVDPERVRQARETFPVLPDRRGGSPSRERTPVPDPRGHVAGQLREQARSCAEMASPLYEALLDRAAADVEGGGPCWDVLSAHVAPGRGDAVALRFMAAVHRLVLTGRAPDLARHYTSTGGQAGHGAWEAFRDLVTAHWAELRALTGLPCQTNEVGRSAPLMFGFLAVAATWGLPLRVLEVGASAGLNLRFDRFRYGGGGAAWGDPASPVDLTGHWREAPAHLDAPLVVAERLGCDRRPLDPTDPETGLALRASIWADQAARLSRLDGALALAREVPATVDAALLTDWLPGRLRESRPGRATVVSHSVVLEYLPECARLAFESLMAEAGARATREAPLAWLRLEPISAVRSHGVTLTTWPGGRERVLAISGAHGTDVTRA